MQNCDGLCADTQTDPDNCGGCDVHCPAGDVCTQGVCSLFCSGGTVRCSTDCTNLRDDPLNCGACGVSCGPGAACVDAGCTQLSFGPNEAGATPPVDAGQGPDAEGGPQVDAATLCPEGGALCGQNCVDLAIDMANCGGCTSTCPTGSVCTGGSCESLASDWPMLGHDVQHSGANFNETAVPPPTDQWSVSLGTNGPFSTLSPAVVENGLVILTVTPTENNLYFDGLLVVRNVADGSPVWTYDFTLDNSIGQPSVSNGIVYVQTQDSLEGCVLRAMGAASGAPTWSADFGCQWAHFWAPIVQGGNLYMNGGTTGGLYGYSTSGTELFFNGAIGGGGALFDSWSPAYFGGAVYTFVDGTFQASDPTTGTELWTTTIPWNQSGFSMNTSPVFGDSLGYVISPPSLIAVDPSQQTIPWTADAGYTGTPAVGGGVVYGTAGGNLIASDASTGDLLWTFAGDQNLSYPPAVTNDYVYVASVNNVYAVQISTHQQVWTAAVGGWVTVASGRLLVAGPDGTLSGFVLTNP